MTTEKTLENLQAQHDALYDEIKKQIATDLGFGELDTLDDKQRGKVEERAELVVDHWNEKVTDMSPEDPKLSTPLEKLLHEHYEIGEQILDIQDDRIKHDLNADDDPTDEDAS